MKQSRKFFHVSILSTTRNGFSLFSSCQREFILFFSYFPSCRNALSARQWAKSAKSELVFPIFKSEIAISTISFVTCRSLKSKKSHFSSFENPRGIVRRANVRKPANSVQPISQKVEKKRTVRQGFFMQQIRLFCFFTMPPNDRGYGHWRFAGEFPVVKRQGKCGRKTCKVHISQPVNIGVC